MVKKTKTSLYKKFSIILFCKFQLQKINWLYCERHCIVDIVHIIFNKVLTRYPTHIVISHPEMMNVMYKAI